MTIVVPRFIRNNRGDILSRWGLLRELSLRAPGAHVVVVTDNAPDCFPMEVERVTPGPAMDLLPRLAQLRHCRRGNTVLWACGHDLTDESSSLLIPHMLLKLATYKALGMRVHIVAQGAGPIRTRLGRLWVRLMMRLVDSASLRDPKSRDLVRGIAGPGCEAKLSVSADTALLACEPGPRQDNPRPLLGVNVRRWHHFDGHFLPYEYRMRLGMLRQPPGQEVMDRFERGFAAFLDGLVRDHGLDVRFIPMYPPDLEPWEDDAAMAGRIVAHMEHGDRAGVYRGDDPPSAWLGEFARLDYMIGVRLHSTIAATAMGVPSLHLAYSPKGRAYFRRIGASDFCLPLESLTLEERWDALRRAFDALAADSDGFRRALEQAMPGLREAARSALDVPLGEAAPAGSPVEEGR